jgi:hypothetical protein
MEVEFSNSVRGGLHAFVFTTDEKQLIIKAFQKHIAKLQKNIIKVEEHPDNEGQATFLCRLYELRYEVKSYEENIANLKRQYNVEPNGKINHDI